MNRKTFAALQGIMRHRLLEDRLEYDAEDLELAYELSRQEALALRSALQHLASRPQDWRGLNQKFLLSLEELFGAANFDAVDYYGVYYDRHWHSWQNYTPEEKAVRQLDGWGRMSARNTIYRAVKIGILRKTVEGRHVSYSFS
jgi:hypothetical protein